MYFSIQRALFLNKFGQTKMFYPEYFNHRSQDLKDAFHDAGQFYWGTSEIGSILLMYMKNLSHIFYPAGEYRILIILVIGKGQRLFIN